jgi:hypothetical protein
MPVFGLNATPTRDTVRGRMDSAKSKIPDVLFPDISWHMTNQQVASGKGQRGLKKLATKP